MRRVSGDHVAECARELAGRESSANGCGGLISECARLRETMVHEPEDLGFCAVLVERAAATLLALLVGVER